MALAGLCRLTELLRPCGAGLRILADPLLCLGGSTKRYIDRRPSTERLFVLLRRFLGL